MTEAPQEDPITEEQAAEPAEPDTEFEPDADQPAEPEPELEPEPVVEPVPAGPTPEALERATRSLETSCKTYFKAVERFQEATGQSLYRDGVSLDFAPGFIFDPSEVALNEDQVMAALILSGQHVDEPLENDPLSAQCATCKGRGLVGTGSRVQGETTATCDTCHGHGFIGERLTRMLMRGPVAGNGAQVQELPPVYSETPRDQWRTPLGHPGYGIGPEKWPLEWHEILKAMNDGAPPMLTSVVG